MRPADGPYVDVRSIYGAPLNGTVCTSQEKFEFASAATPASRLIRDTHKGGLGRIGIGNRCMLQYGRRAPKYRASSRDGKGKPPNSSTWITEKTEAVSGSVLTLCRVVASCDKGAKFGLKLSYWHVCCSGSILVRGTGREEHDKRYHPRHPCQVQMNAEEVLTGHAWMLTHAHMQSKAWLPIPIRDTHWISEERVLQRVLGIPSFARVLQPQTRLIFHQVLQPTGMLWGRRDRARNRRAPFLA